MSQNVTLAVMVFTAVGCGVMLLALLWEWFSERRRSRDITARLEGMAKGERTPGGDPFGELFRDAAAKDVKWLQPVVARLPHTSDLQHLMDQADMNWRVGTYLLVTTGVATAFGLVTLLLIRIPYIAVAVAAFSATLPYMYVKRRKTKRMRKFEEHFPESIDLLGRAIRAGHAFSTGLQMVADEAPQPIGMEFRRVFEEQKFGLSLEDSLMALADRIELLDMRIFVTAVMIQREVGGNLAEILDKISYTIRERFTIERQVRVYTAQGRFTGYLLAGLPIAVGFLIYMLNREYMTILWERPVGRLLIAVAAVLQVIGFFIIRKIINIKI